MQKRYWFVLAVGLVFVMGFLPLAGLGWGSKPKPALARDLEVTLSVDKDSYRSSDTIRVTLQVANRTAHPITLPFATSQRFDLAIENEGGNEIWLWSRGKIFLQVLGEETLDPGGPALTYHAEAPPPEGPGRFRLLGTLTTTSQALSVSTFFTVLP